MRLRTFDDETLHLVAAIVRMGPHRGADTDAAASEIQDELERRVANHPTPNGRPVVFLDARRRMR
ncbi:MAG: hypothetical protein ACR2GG_10470 [Gemmatimonadaceae bacterium]